MLQLRLHLRPGPDYVYYTFIKLKEVVGYLLFTASWRLMGSEFLIKTRLFFSRFGVSNGVTLVRMLALGGSDGGGHHHKLGKVFPTTVVKLVIRPLLLARGGKPRAEQI
ncbi:hypothetical protein ATANTOWER_017076 [Ataeniobius toweri]|uniref:Uncharacterized protein n=1 Tax=Ataeniobius toweri TaxID=208326 RepID=A0ABU7A891_9TELE|nr:hypothetical protein [Ataeniobius toweri]